MSKDSKPAPKERRYFPYWRHYSNIIQYVDSDEVCLALYEALADYCLYGVEPDLSKVPQPQQFAAAWHSMITRPRSRSGEPGTRRYFAFFEYYHERIQADVIDAADRLAIYDALVDIGLDETQPDFKEAKNKSLCMIIFADFSEYIKISWRLFKNGSAGGAPIGSKNNPYGRKGKTTNQELT